MMRESCTPLEPRSRSITAPDGSGVYHVVERGQTLYRISRAYGVSVTEIKEANAQLQQQVNEKTKALQGYAELKKAEEESKKRAESINRLLATKVVPAHVLHELGKVLTKEGPTMTETMAKLAGNGTDGDPNKRFVADWDTTHVWMTSFTDTAGVFRLDGGAQSESDVTQLSKRLAASVYFLDVTPAGGERVVDRETNLNYYRYTITGRLAY